jgi:DUF971 family protein
MPPTPQSLDLNRTEALTVTWEDGTISRYTIGYLRSKCPCASCKQLREEQQSRKALLTILPGDYSKPLSALGAELVGNYALRIDWSDNHSAGIYSFQYLREIAP